jgi:hypothetical protein
MKAGRMKDESLGAFILHPSSFLADTGVARR